MKIKPDAVLFVGDLGEGDIRIVKAIKRLPFPTALILGNHDRARDMTGEKLKTQLSLLGNIHCGWKLRDWESPPISVVGARPCSAGGGFHLSHEVQAVFGQVSIETSVERIVLAAKEAPLQMPMIILAHSGPTGLGSKADSPCGRDWKSPSLDWGDTDLEMALTKIRKYRIPDLVVFGHMHHALMRNNGSRCTFVEDSWGIRYLNTACVPRRGKDSSGQLLCHFSWVEFEENLLTHVSHRWFRSDASIAYEELLYSKNKPGNKC